jgi:hypothetical protein
MFIKSIPALKKTNVYSAFAWYVSHLLLRWKCVLKNLVSVNGKEVYLIHEPMAAAIGIGIDIMQPKEI